MLSPFGGPSLLAAVASAAATVRISLVDRLLLARLRVVGLLAGSLSSCVTGAIAVDPASLAAVFMLFVMKKMCSLEYLVFFCSFPT